MRINAVNCSKNVFLTQTVVNNGVFLIIFPKIVFKILINPFLIKKKKKQMLQL